MDGIDGILAGCMIIVMGTASIIFSPIIFIIVASLIGFIYWNWQPAKIFMGDIGSTYLGAMLLGYILSGDNIMKIISMLIAC